MLIRSDHAPDYIQRQVDELFQQRKLVLVLDLDNTLIHAQEAGFDKARRVTEVRLLDLLHEVYGVSMAG